MNPDNPFDKTKTVPTRVEPKTEPTKVEPTKVEPTKVEPAKTVAVAQPGRQVTGSVQLIGPKGSGVARLLNRSAFSLTGCKLRLPGALIYRFTKEIYAGSAADVPITAFAADTNPPDPQLANGWAPVYCSEGTGYLRIYDQRQ